MDTTPTSNSISISMHPPPSFGIAATGKKDSGNLSMNESTCNLSTKTTAAAISSTTLPAQSFLGASSTSTPAKDASRPAKESVVSLVSAEDDNLSLCSEPEEENAARHQEVADDIDKLMQQVAESESSNSQEQAQEQEDEVVLRKSDFRAAESSTKMESSRQMNDTFGTDDMEVGDADGADQRNLYVSGLPASVTEEKLGEMFQPFGEIVSLKLMLNIHTGVSRGFAFVLYKETEAAHKAVASMDHSTIDNHRLTVRFAERRACQVGLPTKKIFIRNIPSGTTERSLRALFESEEYNIIQLSMRPDPYRTSGASETRNPNVAHVIFDTFAQAESAAKKLHNSYPWPGCKVPILAKVVDTGVRAKKETKTKEAKQSKVTKAARSEKPNRQQQQQQQRGAGRAPNAPQQAYIAQPQPQSQAQPQQQQQYVQYVPVSHHPQPQQVLVPAYGPGMVPQPQMAPVPAPYVASAQPQQYMLQPTHAPQYIMQPQTQPVMFVQQPQQAQAPVYRR